MIAFTPALAALGAFLVVMVAAASAQASSAALQWPMQAGTFRLTSRFGKRRRLFKDGKRLPADAPPEYTNHDGIDLAAPVGTPVFAVAAGTVSRADFSSSYGNVVYLDHGQGRESRYAHLDRLDVAKGQAVAGGAPIGTSGNTGRSTGPHLHFEYRVNGQAVDPIPHLPAETAALT